MINIVEKTLNNQIGFQVIDDETGETRTVSYTTHQVEYRTRKYFIFYDYKMQPIEAGFDFINFYLSDRSQHTQFKAGQALKLLYAYEDIMNKSLKNFKQSDINNFKRFLHGFDVPGNSLNITLTSTRSNSTVNAYLSIYRQYLIFLGENNTILSRRASNHQYFDSYRESSYQVNEFVSNERVANPIEVPKYISVNDFIRIIEVIRSDYSIREELIVRLMFQCGLRIGETLGLTFEDLEIIHEDNSDICLAYIRNRYTDQPYQMAKSCINISDRKQYDQKDYQLRDVGFQIIVMPLDLFDLTNDYINESHLAARNNYKENYYKLNLADTVTKDFKEDNFYVFINSLGKPLSQANWNQYLRKIFEKAGISLDSSERRHNLNHRFRHGFAMFNVQHLNLNEFELKERMRHRSIESVASYFNPTIKDQIALKSEFVDSLYDIYPELNSGGY